MTKSRFPFSDAGSVGSWESAAAKVSMGGGLSRVNHGLLARRARAAFTLIELLVVIAIIAILAGLTFEALLGINKVKVKARVRGELAQIETAIIEYKTKRGHYPPDNGGNFVTNQLYYELLGTKLDNTGYFTTLDGSARIRATQLPMIYSPAIGGFVNSASGGSGDEGVSATAFIRGLKPGQIGKITSAGETVSLLVTVPWQPGPVPFNFSPVPGTTLNPWRYNSSNPTNNPGTFDLWADVIVGSQAFRFCNWSKTPLKISTP